MKMDTKTIVLLVGAVLLGMVISNMFKSNCNVVEGFIRRIYVDDRRTCEYNGSGSDQAGVLVQREEHQDFCHNHKTERNCNSARELGKCIISGVEMDLPCTNKNNPCGIDDFGEDENSFVIRRKSS